MMLPLIIKGGINRLSRGLENIDISNNICGKNIPFNKGPFAFLSV